MRKPYFNVAVILFSSWTVYSYCQEDTLLPLIAAGIVIPSFLLRSKTSRTQFAFFKNIPLSTIIILSFIVGFFWRSIFPVPEEAISPFPGVTAAFQTGTIFATILIWLKPFSRNNLITITFLAWLTVAVSINVPFPPKILFIFCFFCIVAIAMILLQTMKKPQAKKHLFSYYRDYIVFSTLLIMLTTGFFYGISRTIVIFDEVFMNMMTDYIIPRNFTHFLRMDPFLNLNSPGRSARDKRPVLEIRIPDIDGVYLKTQIFKDFNNGTWQELKDVKTTALPKKLNKNMINGKMTMFTSLESIIPSPEGVVAAKGNVIYQKSVDNIIYTEDEQRARLLEFSLSRERLDTPLTPQEFAQYTTVPPDMARDLKTLSTEIVGDEKSLTGIASKVEVFFRDNFKYSLSVDFKGDNDGILAMIKERRASYCSYFATAMTLILRSKNIPSRVATGFLTGEIIDRRRNVFLARVSNAHAWTEVLLPEMNERSGEIIYTWQNFDPTPTGGPQQALGSIHAFNLMRYAEGAWLGFLRFGAHVENMDKNKLKFNLLLSLLGIMLFINRKNVCRVLRNILDDTKKNLPKKRIKPNPFTAIYLRYEKYLKKAFGEHRNRSDTDGDVLTRIKGHPKIPQETIAKLESFLLHYQAARFGEKRKIDLETIIKTLEVDGKNKA